MAMIDFGEQCSIDGCEKPAGKRRGWCRMHYVRWQRHGDTSVVKSRRVDGYVPYQTVHVRLTRDRGPASNYLCDTCGKAAEQWSYTGGDPDELWGEGRGAYSIDQSFYRPLCRTCHSAEDAARKRHAKQKAGAM